MKILIAAGKATLNRLSPQQEELKEAFNTQSIEFCENCQELNDAIDGANILVFYSDFPMSNSGINSLVKESQSVDNVVALEYASENKLWLYYGSTVANCIVPTEEIPALRRAIAVPRYVNIIGQWVAFIALLFLFVGSVAYSHQCYMALQTQNTTVEEAQKEETTSLD